MDTFKQGRGPSLGSLYDADSNGSVCGTPVYGNELSKVDLREQI